MAVVYVWRPGVDIYGHASLQLENGTYISWWPRAKEDRKAKVQGTSLAMLGDRPAAKLTYKEDEGEEGKRPEERIQLPRGALKEGKIWSWWSSYKAMYNVATNNCATVVYRALCEGGASVPMTTKVWASIIPGPWTPVNVGQYAREITN